MLLWTAILCSKAAPPRLTTPSEVPPPALLGTSARYCGDAGKERRRGMKRQWTADELVEHWTLHPSDLELLAQKVSATRLGYAVLLKYFQYDGRFPQYKGDVPPAALIHV